MWLPVIMIMKPILPAALSLTLVLTGFACAFVGVSMLQNTGNQSKAIAIFMAVVIAKYGAAWGLASGVICYLLMVWRPKIEIDWYNLGGKK
jgi:NADH:ubiquinone oxidoreductase subunit K